MTHSDFAVLSNNAVTGAAVVYFLAFLAHIAQWAYARAGAPAPVAIAATVGGSDGPADTLVASRDEAGVPAETAHKVALFGRIGIAVTVVAALLHLVAVVSRGFANDPVRVPWGNMYEFTMTGTLVVTLLYLALFRRYRLSWLGPVVTAFVMAVLMLSVLVLYVPAAPLTPALHSPWLVIHVVAAIIATGAFTIGGMSSVLFLVKERADRRGTTPGGYVDRLPSTAVLDRVAYRMHAFGFPIWTFAALIAGPIWAQYAWSRYWGWDPKEVWAFITWVVYAAYLHARATAGWRGQKAAIVALVGLATLWFNFVGINFFFGQGSQHSYAEGLLTTLLHYR